jgi:hypothetical protein
MPIEHKKKVKEIWPMLIEKAMAKAYGGYDALRGGTIDSAFMDMTGGAAIKFDFADSNTQQMIAMYQSSPQDSLFGILQNYINQGYVLGAATEGTEEVTTEFKIVRAHAYAILDIVSYDGNHLIQLKNPWGRLVGREITSE